MTATLIVKCVYCGLKREIKSTDEEAGEQPICKEDGGVMVPVLVEAK